MTLSSHWLSVAPVDLRRGIDGLSSIVQQTLEQAPCSGSAFVFCNRAGNRLKVLLWDGNGVWVCQRRLHHGSFVWPKEGACCFTISEAQYPLEHKWQWLIAGVDWYRLSAVPSADWQI